MWRYYKMKDLKGRIIAFYRDGGTIQEAQEFVDKVEKEELPKLVSQVSKGIDSLEKQLKRFKERQASHREVESAGRERYEAFVSDLKTRDLEGFDFYHNSPTDTNLELLLVFGDFSSEEQEFIQDYLHNFNKIDWFQDVQGDFESRIRVLGHILSEANERLF